MTAKTRRSVARTLIEGIVGSIAATLILAAAKQLPVDTLEWILSAALGIGGMIATQAIVNRKLVPWAEKQDGGWPGFVVLGVAIIGGTLVALAFAWVGIYAAGLIKA